MVALLTIDRSVASVPELESDGDEEPAATLWSFVRAAKSFSDMSANLQNVEWSEASERTKFWSRGRTPYGRNAPVLVHAQAPDRACTLVKGAAANQTV